MLLVSYDFTDNKTRSKFHKFLKKFGRPIQFSLFEIKNSPRILSIIQLEIEKTYAPEFTNADSVLIVPITIADRTRIVRYGYSVQEEQEVLWIDN